MSWTFIGINFNDSLLHAVINIHNGRRLTVQVGMMWKLCRHQHTCSSGFTQVPVFYCD